MEYLVVNLAGKLRREQRDGREYLVSPATLIVPGVLNGSKGPLLYPLDEIRNTADAWNGMPIVVGHPTKDGSPVSARSPEVLDQFGIGDVFRVTVNDKLTAETWFDVLKTESVDSRIIPALKAGKPLELSTGLFTENEAAPAGSVTDNGTAYNATARNYKPDHLAILPDSVGACSVADGCGVLVNSASLVGYTGRTKEHQHVATVNSEGGNGITNEVDGHRHQVKKFRVLKDARGGHTHPLDKTGLVDSGVRNQLENKESEMDDATKKTAIDGLIANVCCWEEKDREVLNALPDEQLTSLVENGEKVTRQELVANAAAAGYEDAMGSHKIGETGEWVHDLKEQPTDNAKTLTREDVLTDEDKEDLAFARNEKQRQKNALVETLTANVADADKPAHAERLQARSLADLQADVGLLPEVKTETPPVANWAGASGGPRNVAPPAVEKDDFLPVPTMNFKPPETE